MNMPIKSARGVYYDLDKSPYIHIGVCGDSYKFRSKKRLEIFERELPKRIDQFSKCYNKVNQLIGYVHQPKEITKSKFALVLENFYFNKVEEQLYKEVMEGKNPHSNY